MPLPSTAPVFERLLDPTDIDVFKILLSQGASDEDLLAPGENVDSYTLTLSPEAVTAGLLIKSGGGYATTLAGLEVTFWLEVDSDDQASPLFDGSGMTLGIELTIDTTSSPPRRKQRTVAVTVVNQ